MLMWDLGSWLFAGFHTSLSIRKPCLNSWCQKHLQLDSGVLFASCFTAAECSDPIQVRHNISSGTQLVGGKASFFAFVLVTGFEFKIGRDQYLVSSDLYSESSFSMVIRRKQKVPNQSRRALLNEQSVSSINLLQDVRTLEHNFLSSGRLFLAKFSLGSLAPVGSLVSSSLYILISQFFPPNFLETEGQKWSSAKQSNFPV